MINRIVYTSVFILGFLSISLAQVQDEIQPTIDSVAIGTMPETISPSTVDELVTLQFADCDGSYPEGTILNEYGYPSAFIPTYDDAIIQARLSEMNTNSAISFDYNNATLAYVKLFSDNKRGMISRMMGLAELYFPLYEQKLAEYGLPKELKYLSIIESALNPVAKSRSGAAGLWQFMPPTGKLFGLTINNEIDERKDPEQATEAACKYLKELYGYFGDWQLALSAYNAGPGTIRKAITKSGGKRTYWELRPYLPKETQGYVPAFIGAAYVMNFAHEHNICRTAPKFTYNDLTKVEVSGSFSFNHLAEVLEVPIEDLKYLNPVYKNDAVAVNTLSHTICLPKDKLCDYNYCEQDIYNMYLCSTEPDRNNPQMELEMASADPSSQKTLIRTHVVKKGESLGLIAKKYNCSVSDITAWNELKKGTIYIGQKLSVHTVDVAQLMAKSEETIQKEEKKTEQVSNENNSNTTNKSLFVYYTVQKGDTLWDIANQSGISVQKLKSLNNIRNEKSLKPGTRIKVGIA